MLFGLVIVSFAISNLAWVYAVEGNCKSGWHRFENKCYRIFTKKNDNISNMDFDDASRYCQEQHPDSTLVTISSQNEQDFVTSELGQSDVDGAILIGLKRPNRYSRHEWIDGTNLKFQNWVKGEPSNSNGNEGCAQMQTYETTAGQWNDIPCDTEKEFVCQSKPDPSIPKGETEPGELECPNNSVKYRQSCYTLSNEYKSWSEAEEACLARGAHLVSIQDNFESVFLKRLLHQQEGSFWIGLKATLSHLELFGDKQRHYMSWSDHRPVQHLEWDNNEPNYSADQDTQCVQLENNLKWSVADCQVRKPFICVKHTHQYEMKKRVEGFCPNKRGVGGKIIDVGNANCYLLNSGISDPNDFEGARTQCKEIGGDLAVFETREELNLLRPYLWKSEHRMFWVGVRAKSDGDFKTLTGKEIPENMWHEGEPNLLSVEKCAAIYSQSMQLFNFRCHYSHNYICEIPKVATKEEATKCEDNEFKCHNSQCIDLGNLCDGDNDCGDNSDELTHICNENRTCPNGGFLCGSYSKCISSNYLCDGDNDCGNGKDEEGCPPKTCDEDELLCDNGKCKPLRYRCDGDNDCGDYSDERDCDATIATSECDDHHFKCENGDCISLNIICDGDNDCPDKSDESTDICNENRTCPDEKFLCGTSGKCINQNFVCDGDNDCGNGKDEEGCPIKTCKSDEFFCGTNKCVSLENRCDGDNDCGDNSDEEDCVNWQCVTGRWKCDNNKCVQNRYRCDGDNDCGDNTDERDCDATNATRECVNDQFQCANGECVSMNNVCDSNNDCDDQSDESTEICNENRTCPDGKFLCGASGKCINQNYVCDGDNDCENGKDEEGCPIKTCKSDEFFCGTNKCVSLEYRCDGDNDCGDNSDERDCPIKSCKSSEFLCGTNKCVSLEYRCDGDNDCGDNSDEKDCAIWQCVAGRLKCDNNKCVKNLYRCDGSNDCGDNTDERDCLSESFREKTTTEDFTARDKVIDLVRINNTDNEVTDLKEKIGTYLFD